MNLDIVVDRAVRYGPPAGLLVTTLLHPQVGREATGELASAPGVWLVIHVVQLVLIAGLAATVRRMLAGIDTRPARIARGATLPFAAVYAGYDAFVGLGAGVLAAHASGLSGPARDAVLAAGDSLFVHPIAVAMATVGVAAWLIATVGAAWALRPSTPPAVPVGLIAAGVLFGATHVGAIGFGGAVALLLAVHVQATGPTPSMTAGDDTDARIKQSAA